MKTVFDIDDIYALRIKREAEYGSMSATEAHRLRTQRADVVWAEIAKMRTIVNNYYKYGNILSAQPDKLPPMQMINNSELTGNV